MSDALTWSAVHRAAAALVGGGSATLETLRTLGSVGGGSPVGASPDRPAGRDGEAEPGVDELPR
jgi:hypothetical protein